MCSSIGDTSTRVLPREKKNQMTKIVTETIDIDELTPHPRNARQGDTIAISESLSTHGQYRSITYQESTGHILAGNHTWKAAKALGWKTINATSVDCDDDEALRILLVDNRTSDLANYDDAALVEILKTLADTTTGLEGTLYDGDDLEQLLKELDQPTDSDDTNIYSQAVKVPQYEIVGDKPATSELSDRTRTNKLQQQIHEADLPDDVRNFLMEASTRHTVFNYAKIAEYYPHQTPEVQQLMEQSVLIIIDFEDAIANGYANYARTIDELQQLDADDDA